MQAQHIHTICPQYIHITYPHNICEIYPHHIYASTIYASTIYASTICPQHIHTIYVKYIYTIYARTIYASTICENNISTQYMQAQLLTEKFSVSVLWIKLSVEEIIGEAVTKINTNTIVILKAMLKYSIQL